jgi:hypothetical protein
MPNKQTKNSKASGKLKLTQQTIKDLKLTGDKAAKLKGMSAGPALCVAAVSGGCANKISASGGCYTL